MAKKLHALEYLASPQRHPPRPICAVFGDEAFLRRQVILQVRSAVLGSDEGDFSLSTFDGVQAELRDVLEDLDTVAMFGDGRRLVVIEGADDFVGRYREKLEDYAAAPSSAGVLVLELNSFPANTRLYKALAADGLLIECKPPSTAQLGPWLIDRARQVHQAELAAASAEILVEIIGTELGLLDQELAKLALIAGEQKKIAPELVRQSVGGWRTKTVWEMLDAALGGNAPEAMLQLDRLLAAGEQPLGILGPVSVPLRRLAAAARLIIETQAAGRRIALLAALQEAGVPPFFLKKTESQLRRLGRERAAMLYDWLLEADLDLKGASPLPGRLILERLIVRLAAPRVAIDSGR